MLLRRVDERPKDTMAAEGAGDEEADDRPHVLLLIPALAVSHPRAVGMPRRNRAPGNRGVTVVAKNPDGNAGADALPHRCLAAGAVDMACLLARCAPDHAPAALRPAAP